jgi:hypothetical protein
MIAIVMVAILTASLLGIYSVAHGRDREKRGAE